LRQLTATGIPAGFEDGKYDLADQLPRQAIFETRGPAANEDAASVALPPECLDKEEQLSPGEAFSRGECGRIEGMQWCAYGGEVREDERLGVDGRFVDARQEGADEGLPARVSR
jgi:hypothetical protein